MDVKTPGITLIPRNLEGGGVELEHPDSHRKIQLSRDEFSALFDPKGVTSVHGQRAHAKLDILHGRQGTIPETRTQTLKDGSMLMTHLESGRQITLSPSERQAISGADKQNELEAMSALAKLAQLDGGSAKIELPNLKQTLQKTWDWFIRRFLGKPNDSL